MKQGVAVYDQQQRAQAIIGLGVIALTGAIGLAALLFTISFAWPTIDDAEQRFLVRDAWNMGIDEPLYVREGNFWVVRRSDDTFLAFPNRDSSRRGQIEWLAEPYDLTTWDGRIILPGIFVSEWCKFDSEGNRIFGACPRGLDRHPVDVTWSHVEVNTASQVLIVDQRTR